MIRIGITGTDTGIGKTTVACGVLALMREAGVLAAAMKPVETGVSGPGAGSDADRLRAVAGAPHALELVRPYAFADPVSPWAAAERAGTTIDPDRLDFAYARVSDGMDAVLVEGAGGALVPLTATMTVLDLFRRWSLDLIIVASNRLGVLNHALLTERAVRSVGLTTRAIVLVDPPAPDDSCAENAELLARLTAVPVRVFRRVPDPMDARMLAAAAADARLDSLFARLTPTPTIPA